MRLNKLFAVLSAAGIMAMVGPAQASITFQFNPLGNGTGVGLINGAGLLDQAPGNVNSINGAGGGGAVPVGTVITDLYQSNLSAVQKLSTANLFSNGDFGQFFTFVANFSRALNSTCRTHCCTSTCNSLRINQENFHINGDRTCRNRRCWLHNCRVNH